MDYKNYQRIVGICYESFTIDTNFVEYKLTRKIRSIQTKTMAMAMLNDDDTISMTAQLGFHYNGLFFPLSVISTVAAGNIVKYTNEVIFPEDCEIAVKVLAASGTPRIRLYCNCIDFLKTGV